MKFQYFTKQIIDVTGINTVKKMMLVMPNSKTSVTCNIATYSNSSFLMELYEGATVSNNGTELTAFDMDRNDSVGVRETKIYNEPTVTSYGTKIWQAKTWETFSNQTTNYFLTLKRNTKYIMKMTKLKGETHFIDLNIFWDENVVGGI